jgi:hypothetical protein
MQRCAILLFTCLCFIVGCGDRQSPPAQAQPPTVVVVMQMPKGDADPKTDQPKVDPLGPKLEDSLPKGLSTQERYDQFVARAFQLLAEKKDEGGSRPSAGFCGSSIRLRKGEMNGWSAHRREASIDQTV